MPNVQPSGIPPISNQLGQPPNSGSDGPELYIQKLLSQGGMAPPSWNKDAFERAGVPSAQTNRTFADQALQWAGVLFVGALAVLGLKHLGGSAKKAAGTVSKP